MFVKDQLTMIFSICGTPKESFVQQLEKNDTQVYVRCFQERKPVALRTIDRFKGASKLSLSLLEKMIIIDPNERFTIDECLQHPLFE